MSDGPAFQDLYPEGWSHCYGCGRLNDKGLRVRSFWDGEETVCVMRPRAEHIAIPGIVYGGYLASIVDCHSTGSAAAAAHRAAGQPPDAGPLPRFLTGTLRIEYLKPTPVATDLHLRSRIVEVKGRKISIATELSAGGVVTVRGEAICLQVPEDFAPLP